MSVLCHIPTMDSGDSGPDMMLVCVSPQNTGLICLLIQMSYGNVETLLGDNLAGVKSQKPVFSFQFFKIVLLPHCLPRVNLN